MVLLLASVVWMATQRQSTSFHGTLPRVSALETPLGSPPSEASALEFPYLKIARDQPSSLPFPPLSPIEGNSAARLPASEGITVVRFSELDSPALPDHAIPLRKPQGFRDTYYRDGLLGQLQDSNGTRHYFVPQSVLIKFRGSSEVSALRVEATREVEALARLKRRDDVVFAELDLLQERQALANDPLAASQWHHSVIDSPAAWDVTTGSRGIRIGIVDTPFQMDHPDLLANVDPGWSVVTNGPITASEGIEHSTLGAGLAAAVFNNALGVAGMVNCRLVPIHINGFTSEMYDAIHWAADNNVRVLNISWSGADSDVLNEAALYLQTRLRGIVAMPGVNGTGFLNYPNQPNLYCISMTDAADNMRSRNGDHIDFAAPGDALFSTTVGSRYAGASGTSFATPVFAGVVAALFSINPTLSSEEIIEILKTSAEDLGVIGWDRFYGWGRIHFGRAAMSAHQTLPALLEIQQTSDGVRVMGSYRPGLDYTLWKALSLPAEWHQLPILPTATNGNVIRFDATGDPEAQAFYQLRALRADP